jgi:hypothetical protein
MIGSGGSPFVVQDYCGAWPVPVPHAINDARYGIIWMVANQAGVETQLKLEIDGYWESGTTIPSTWTSDQPVTVLALSGSYSAGPHDFVVSQSTDGGSTWSGANATLFVWDVPDASIYVASCG